MVRLFFYTVATLTVVTAGLLFYYQGFRWPTVGVVLIGVSGMVRNAEDIYQQIQNSNVPKS